MQTNRLNIIIPEAAKKAAFITPQVTKPGKQAYRYPTTAELNLMINNIVDYELHIQTSDATKVATHKLAACLDAAFPYFLTYERHIKTCDITKQHLIKHIPQFKALPEGIQRSFLRKLDAVKQENEAQLTQMREFLKRQQDLMESWSEHQVSTLLQIQEQINPDAMQTGGMQGQQYKYKGKVFTCVGVGKMRCTKTGTWIDSVVYTNKNGSIFTRGMDDFASNFKLIKTEQ